MRWTLYSMLTLCTLFTAPSGSLLGGDGNRIAYPYEPYNQGKLDPQITGWPLTEPERTYVTQKAEHDRRPGRESNQYLPAKWPVIPCAGHWGGTSWLDTHTRLVEYVQANRGPIDVLLVGDSITQQWGSPLDKGELNDAWKEHFSNYKTINIGIGGDKSQNVLWRLDHGGVDGLKPRVIVLMIGNNNMFFTRETGIQSAAQGIQMCVTNLSNKFPDTPIVVVKILPCHAPGNPFYEDIRKTNSELNTIKLEDHPDVQVLDLEKNFLEADGTLKRTLYGPDSIHLSPAGYALYAEQLKPVLVKLLGEKGLGGNVIIPAKKPQALDPTSANSSKVPPIQPSDGSSMVATEAMLRPSPKSADGKNLVYPYAPYNSGRMDPQISGWPLSDTEATYVSKGEYFRKPGHEIQKHLPEFWFVTPTAAHWQSKEDIHANTWIEHHATCISNVKAMRSGIDVVLLGDSITQGWGGGWDGTPFHDVWQKHFGDQKTVNLGIAGDRIENILWRLDHGALDGAAPKVVVLMIGVNNAPLVQANGVPAISAAVGIKLCVENIRMRCPEAYVLVVKILPAFNPSEGVGSQVTKINNLLDTCQLEVDPMVKVLDASGAFLNRDGSLNAALYSDKHLHLNRVGYEALAREMNAVLGKLLR